MGPYFRVDFWIAKLSTHVYDRVHEKIFTFFLEHSWVWSFLMILGQLNSDHGNWSIWKTRTEFHLFDNDDIPTNQIPNVYVQTFFKWHKSLCHIFFAISLWACWIKKLCFGTCVHLNCKITPSTVTNWLTIENETASVCVPTNYYLFMHMLKHRFPPITEHI